LSFSILAQAILNGLMAGALIALPAIGFTMIFAVLRYANFAVAAYISIGAFAGLVANVSFGLPIIAALSTAFIVAGASAMACERYALEPLRPSGALTVAIASIGLNLVLENILRFIFGNDLRGYALPIVPDLRFMGVRFGMQQIDNLKIALVMMALVFLFLKFTRIGMAMRAVADNPDLARLKGIDPRKVALITAFVAGGLAGSGGVLIGLDTSIDPLTGFRVILTIFAATVLGGLGSIPGAVLGALALGVGEELALMVLPLNYRTAIGFAVILLMLTFRPRGLLGDKGA
jgi:branched-chain amino acid transport system permease protein